MYALSNFYKNYYITYVIKKEAIKYLVASFFCLKEKFYIFDNFNKLLYNKYINKIKGDDDKWQKHELKDTNY